jgi:parallel beta-helix repeat protein
MFRDMIRVTLALCLTALISESKILFVDNSTLEAGSKWDSIDGHPYSIATTQGIGFSTIKAATSIAEAGDTVYIRKGTYNEHSITIKNSGTPTSKILISNYFSEKVIIDGLMDVGSDSALFKIDKVSHITINGLNMTGFGTDFWGGSIFLGARFKCSNIIIKNCEIYTDKSDVDTDNPSLIVMYSTDSCSIINTKIYLINVPKSAQTSGIKIWKNNTNVLIENCELYGLDGKAIDNKHGVPNQNLIIRNNYLHEITHSEGAIHINAANSIVENNIIVSCRTGILLYHASGNPGGNNTIIRHNTIYECETGIYLGHDNQPQLFNVVVKDNIIMNGRGEFRDFTIAPYATAYTHNHISDYNCYFNASRNEIIREFRNSYSLIDWISAKKQDTHSIQSNPLFVNAATRDFRLSASSPCKHKASDGGDMGAKFDFVGVLNFVDSGKKNSHLVKENNKSPLPQTYSIKKDGKVIIASSDFDMELSIYTLSGTLVHKNYFTSKSDISWDFRNLNGSIVTPGTYIFSLFQNAGQIIKRRILVTK